MRGVSGCGAAILRARATVLRPDVPIGLMSGFGGAQLQERARALGIHESLRKPLRRQDIAKCFERVLSSA
jgi:CheY-like chemotaxis protein